MFRFTILILAATALLLPAPVAGGQHPEFMRWESRSLTSACTEDYAEYCFSQAILGEDTYSGCGAFAKESGDFCEDALLGKICCGDSGDCCDVNVGMVVGVLIAILIAGILLVCGCCFCCKCCCLVSTILLLDPYFLNFCILNIAFVTSF
jgi:hypothetical protein